MNTVVAILIAYAVFYSVLMTVLFIARWVREVWDLGKAGEG